MADAGSSNAYTQAINNAVASAKGMLGKNEVPNRAEIQSYLHDGGQDLDPHKLAWCAAFVSASLQKAGLPVPTQVIKGSAFGPGAYAPNYLTYGSAVEPKNVQAGDILVSNTGSHVGFAEGPMQQGPNGPEVQLLAGNEQDTSGQYAPGSYTSPTGAVAKRSQVGQVGERWVPLSQYSARRYEPADNASSAAAPQPSASSSAAPSQPIGTTLNSNVIDTLGRNIAQIESGSYKNPYEALGPVVPGRGQAIGKYQVMPENVAGWTMAATGHSMSAEEFRASPAAQEAVFRDQMQRSLQLYSPKDAASIWFTGKPYNVAGGAATDRYTKNADYVARATAGLDGGGTFTPTPTSVASGSPQTAAGGPPAVAGAPAPGTTLPGFQPGSKANEMAQQGLKALTGGGGQEKAPQPMQLGSTGPAPMAVGGPMMATPGMTNMMPHRIAQEMLAQQGGMMSPNPAYNTMMGGARPVVPSSQGLASAPLGMASGMPSMPGTTLNSPSQLQMALMSGNISPYDVYAGLGSGGLGSGGLGSA